VGLSDLPTADLRPGGAKGTTVVCKTDFLGDSELHLRRNEHSAGETTRLKELSHGRQVTKSAQKKATPETNQGRTPRAARNSSSSPPNKATKQGGRRQNEVVASSGDPSRPRRERVPCISDHQRRLAFQSSAEFRSTKNKDSRGLPRIFTASAGLSVFPDHWNRSGSRVKLSAICIC